MRPTTGLAGRPRRAATEASVQRLVPRRARPTAPAPPRCLARRAPAPWLPALPPLGPSGHAGASCRAKGLRRATARLGGSRLGLAPAHAQPPPPPVAPGQASMAPLRPVAQRLGLAVPCFPGAPRSRRVIYPPAPRWLAPIPIGIPSHPIPSPAASLLPPPTT